MKIALVTGASKGIGQAIARALATENVAVAIHYNSDHNGAFKLQQEIINSGGNAVLVQGNLSDPAIPQLIIKRVVEELGGIDILINNAAIMTDAKITDLSDQMWDEMIAINLTAAFKLTRESLPYMIKNNWGRVISISSQAAKVGSKNHAHYAASKSGLIGFTNSLAKEVGNSGVTANVIIPGRIETEMIAVRAEGRMDEWMAQTPLNRLGKPDEVASLVMFIASERANYITGASLNVTGGLLM